MDFNTLYNNIKKKKNYNSQRPNHNSKIFRLVIYPQQINVTQKKNRLRIFSCMQFWKYLSHEPDKQLGTNNEDS